MTAKEVEEEFKAKFIALLKEYDANFEICEEQLYYNREGVWYAEVVIQGKYDNDNNCIRESAFFKLPRYLP
jgi:hypothetical protein